MDKWECISCGKVFKKKKKHKCYDFSVRVGNWRKVRVCCIGGCHNLLVPESEADFLCYAHQDAFDRFHE